MNDARSPIKRPPRLALSNWPVRAKVLAIVLVPLLLACAFGALRISASATAASDLRGAATRADVVPAVADYMAALEGVLISATDGGDVPAAMTTFGDRGSALRSRLDGADVDDAVRLATNTLLDYGKDLADKTVAGAIDLRTRVMTYAPLLITAETAVTGLVSGDDAAVRSAGDALARAIGARGQMTMQQMLVDRGGDLPEPDLRSSMITLAGTEPSNVSAMGAYLGGSSAPAASLRSEMVKRMSLLSDPAVVLVGNPDLLASQRVTRGIADGIIAETSRSIPATVEGQANAARTAALRDAALVGAAIVIALLVVAVVARSLIRPLRTLRTSALKVAHEDLAREVEQIRADGKTPPVQPIGVHTSEEIGQVAHAVDELHEQAVLLAGEQARLQMQVTDMFETLSRRNRSLVDQQLALIDRLESNEQDPERLDSLFRLDHLAARMRRNGANLMVLAGARIARDQAEPVPVVALVNAAASEVEDYTRIHAESLPDSAVSGAAAGDLMHLLAELFDNALRYSPPATAVRVSAVHTGNGGLVLEVADGGLGMTESDLRVANARLQSGGEVNPYTARHMGLFVVGRLAAEHGLVVRLRSTTSHQPGSGTTVGVYIPAELLVSAAPPQPPPAPEPAVERPVVAAAPVVEAAPEPAPAGLLPQRRPGASGIAEPVPPSPPPRAPEPAARPEPEPARSDVAAFFAPRPVEHPVEQNGQARHARHAKEDSADDDAIYQKMLSEWLVDPHELSHSADLNWESVWDHGWSAAAAAETAPVLDHTVEGLPVRRPGARLVPGAPDEAGNGSGAHAARDPDAVRAGIVNHFGGVHAGRLRAQQERGTPGE
ncbi:ATP-binding protein [Mycolicibacterium rufum]|uniref:histidine kinase n=1 Tax=Mycolicibacterium rufum TaxID=318424 RepID=A0ABY3UL50_9MYCO|nr:ATP-binding protein [Mycolicibacterium rufum]KGI67162.1 histidine kinase [Mycolicibacterium rufum]ULP38032.1 ATP-binding protein [Mycolicibacterium rufum]